MQSLVGCSYLEDVNMLLQMFTRKDGSSKKYVANLLFRVLQTKNQFFDGSSMLTNVPSSLPEHFELVRLFTSIKLRKSIATSLQTSLQEVELYNFAGTRIKITTCHRSDDQSEVGLEHCDSSTEPKDTEACNTQSCAPAYVIIISSL